MKLFDYGPSSYDTEEEGLMPAEMGSQSQYCLRWNNHQTNLLKSFESLLQEESFTDVTLACEDAKNLHAHRLVLAACSSYFSSLFADISTQQHPIVILKDVHAHEMKDLLSYMYCGQVNVEQNRLQRLLKVAESLKVKGLVEEILSDDCQSQPLPLVTTGHSKAIPLLVSSSSSPAFNESVSRSHSPSPLDNHHHHHHHLHHHRRLVTPDAWESDAIHSRPLRSSSPRSPTRRIRRNSATEDRGFLGVQHPSSSSSSSSPPHLFGPHYLRQRTNPRLDFNVSGGGIRCVKDLYEKDPRDLSPLPSAEDLRDKRLSPFLGPFTTPGAESPPIKRSRVGRETLTSPTPILRTALGHTRNFSSSDVSSLVSLANNMTTFPNLMVTLDPRILPTEDLRRIEERSSERNEVSHSAFKKYEHMSDDDSRHFTEISRDEDLKQEQISNSPQLPDYHRNFHLDSSNSSHFGTFASYVPAKPEWKRYKQYSKIDLAKAIEAVKNGVPALKAAQKYKVPSRTLYDKIKKMGITTTPRRLTSKKPLTTDLDPMEMSTMDPPRDLYLQRPSSREASEGNSSNLSVQTLKIRTCLATEDLTKTPRALENGSSEIDDSPTMETETRGSFSLVGKLFPQENSGPLDLSDTDVLTNRAQIEERA